MAGQRVVPDRVPSGEKVAEVNGGVATYRLEGHLGSLTGLTSSTGASLGSEDYAPFGRILTGSLTDPYLFASLERNQAEMLDHATYRQYSNMTGRWTTPDPYDGSYDLLNPQSFNRYAYVNNNPLGYIDPSGLAGGILNFPGSGKVCKWLTQAVAPCAILTFGISIYCSIVSDSTMCGPTGWTGIFLGGTTAKVIDDGIAALGASSTILCAISGGAACESFPISR